MTHKLGEYVATLLPLCPMAPTTFTSREFNQDTGRAKKAATEGPVYITDRGRPSHVLLSFADYQRLAGNQANVIDVLAEPAGVEDIEFLPPAAPDEAPPADFG